MMSQNELTWRQLRRQRPPLKRLFTQRQLHTCMDRVKLPCTRLERLEALGEWAERQHTRHLQKGSMVYPAKREE